VSFISSAYAQAAGGSPAQTSQVSFIVMMVVIFGAMYFLMIRPQMKRQKELRTMLSAIAKGDEVVTTGGILGRVTKVTDDYISLDIAENTEITVQKAAVSNILPKGTIKSL
jgi:preprotein translocase subunit YajC